MENIKTLGELLLVAPSIEVALGIITKMQIFLFSMYDAEEAATASEYISTIHSALLSQLQEARRKKLAANETDFSELPKNALWPATKLAIEEALLPQLEKLI